MPRRRKNVWKRWRLPWKLPLNGLCRGGRMFYFGAGTSGRIGVLDASECACTYGVPSDMVQAVIPGGYATIPDAALGDEDDTAAAESEIRERGIGEKDVVVGIAASGHHAVCARCGAAARRAGAYTVGVCNNPDTPLERAADAAAVVLTDRRSFRDPPA